MQLVAYGAQDVYLTADPQITFFKAVYRRHTNFAMESMEQTLTGTANFGNKVVCKVSRNGDLMSRVYVNATLPSTNAQSTGSYVNRVGWKLLKQVELRIGGQMIDRHFSTWMQIWSELNNTHTQKQLLDKLVGQTEEDGDIQLADVQAGYRLQIPLLFSFCRHPGLALPLIALQYHEVEIQIDFETQANCMGVPFTGANVTTGALTGVSLFVDYIFLDTAERKMFAQDAHEYLIETVQSQDSALSGTNANSVRLTFNHPTKYIAWAARDSADTATRDSFTGFTSVAAPQQAGLEGLTTVVSSLSNGKLQLNGQDRFSVRDSAYFNYVQPYQHFSGKPDLGVQVYSFALKPEEHQPSGTCNLSRIDNVNLIVTPTTSTVNTLFVYALSYNVFRIASGMGGLAYSN